MFAVDKISSKTNSKNKTGEMSKRIFLKSNRREVSGLSHQAMENLRVLTVQFLKQFSILNLKILFIFAMPLSGGFQDSQFWDRGLNPGHSSESAES